MSDPVEDLKYFVAGFFDGSVQRCMELDELLWLVRLANRHEPEMLHYEAELPPQSGRPSAPAIPNLEDI